MFSMRAQILASVLALGLGFTLAAGAEAAAGPVCVPSNLHASALLGGAVTVSPMPGSRDASPQTQISFLGVPKAGLSVTSVVGSRTGPHSGRLIAYSEGNGASFVPSHRFAEGERVQVSARVTVGSSTKPVSFQFIVAYGDRITTRPAPTHNQSSSAYQRFRSRPDLRPPTVTVTANGAGAAPGDLFLASYAGPAQPGAMILDPSGGLLWFKPMPVGRAITDVRVQEYDGKPVLTWWQGNVIVHGFGLGEAVIADDTYTPIATIKSGNGHQIDLHELQLTPSGTALVTAYYPIHCDVSGAGGPHDGGLVDTVMQEIDVRTGLVMYEWTALDHVPLTDSYVRSTYTSVPEPWDFFHMNSINLDPDGTLLVSSRNTWSIYDVEQKTGRIQWTLGGKHSTIKGAAGTATAWQHDARVLPNGTISLFDNGSAPTVHKQSRGIILQLNPQAKTATLLTQFTHAPATISESMGNVQLLPNGNYMVGWGQVAQLSEYSPTGSLLFDAHLPTLDRSYRDLRFPWSATPKQPPVFAFHGSKTSGTVYASWNGATNVAAWRVLSGAGAAALAPVAQVTRAGFETPIALPPGTAGPYLQVQALDATGNVIRSSTASAPAALKG
jgi:hypothetical protein